MRSSIRVTSGLVAVFALCASADAALILQSASRSVEVSLAMPSGYQTQSNTSAAFGVFGASFSLTGGLSGGSASASQTSDIAVDRIFANTAASGFRGLNSASSMFSVDFALDHPQEFAINVEQLNSGTGQVALYDLTHSQWVFSNPTLDSGGQVNLFGGGPAGNNVAFQMLLSEADYRLTTNAIAVTSDPAFPACSSIDFRCAVPEPAAILVWLLLGTLALAFTGRRKRAA